MFLWCCRPYCCVPAHMQLRRCVHTSALSTRHLQVMAAQSDLLEIKARLLPLVNVKGF